MSFTTSSELMKQLCKWKATIDIAAEKGVRNLVTSLDPSIQQRSTSGQESTGMAVQESVFDRIMTVEVYANILSQCLVPFCQQVYPNGHRFMQDNDPKHMSRRARIFF